MASTPPVASVPTPEAAFVRPALPVAGEVPPSSTTGTETESRPKTSELEPLAPKRSGFGIVLLAAAGLAIGVGGYHFLHHDEREGPPDLGALPPQPVAPSPAAASPSAVNATDAPAQPPAAIATAADFPAAPPAPLDAPVDGAKAPSAAPSSAAAGQAAAAGGERVTITTVPPKAKFFHYGKEVGTAPFVVDLPPGEKRAYEVWLPGHITRKVLVDGSKTEISIGLREEPAH